MSRTPERLTAHQIQEQVEGLLKIFPLDEKVEIKDATGVHPATLRSISSNEENTKIFFVLHTKRGTMSEVLRGTLDLVQGNSVLPSQGKLELELINKKGEFVEKVTLQKISAQAR